MTFIDHFSGDIIAQLARTADGGKRSKKSMHFGFHQANDYSALEIGQKRRSLEKVLIAETLEQQRKRLSPSGLNSSNLGFRPLTLFRTPALMK
ncbi:MAG: hypothetical protein R6X15_08495 [Pseudomonadota bacterium]